ncbi:hypothetical protein JCM24511_07940 [Saitozyma sp. JCM 24511]|nr:hypothetical protein JCM24511_07940 [Saitozyma sp. JCM 24511]
MAPVTLPPSFFNSFWTPDYRSGLEVLFKQLDQGCKENDEVAEFIESQVQGHHALAATLLLPPLSASTSSSSSSLQHTLLTLRGASSARGEAHRALALELESRVLVGFKQWKERHGERIKGARDEVVGKGGAVQSWEKDAHKLNSLKQAYLSKSRAADDSEDDAKFAPTASTAPRVVTSPPPILDKYTASPPPKNAALRRAGTVADRISEKLRQASISKPPAPAHASSLKPVLSVDGKQLPPPPSPLRPGTPAEDGLRSPSSPTREEGFIPPTSPDGRPTMHGPPLPAKNGELALDIQPPPVLLSGLSLTSQALKELLRRLDAYLLTTPAPYSDAAVQPSTRSNAALASRARNTILGTYEKTFSGEEVVEWLRQNVEGFGSDWERCIEAATELYRMGYLHRVGVGRGFDPSYDIYFTLKINPNETTVPLPNISSPLSPATSANIQSMIKSYLPSSLGASDEPLHIRLRREATKADEVYKDAVRVSEEKRLEMEERIERGLRLWERWERERLAVVKQVLKQYEDALARLPGRLADLQSGTSLSVEAFNPEADIKALIEGNRTGPFRPQPHVYESIESDIPDVNFGIDLRKWAGDQGWRASISAPPRPKGAIPEVLEALLKALNEMYTEAQDEERRKSWIYEVPLHETHALRNAINSPSTSVEDMIGVIKQFNVPIVAGTVKLFLLELNPPVLGWEGWEDAKAVYPAGKSLLDSDFGADQERDMTSAVTSVLGRLPGAQLYTLDAVVKHLKELIDSTKTEESNEVYITKLALSVGRCILRPQYETEMTIQDRTPSLFLADLINVYPTVFPPLIEKKKKEVDRVMPIRKRTALVDERISRSSLPEEADPQRLLEAQHLAQHPRAPSPSPPIAGNTAKEPATSASSRTVTPTPTSASAADLGLGRPIMLEPKDDEGSDDEVPHPQGVSAGMGIPIMQEPRDDSDDEAPRQERINVVPPTPEMSDSTRVPDSTTLDQGEDASATADILESMQGSLAADGDVAVSGGNSSNLKRATSGEASRLRGPRGARGPRPAPGRVPSHTQGTMGGMTAVDSPTDGAEAGGAGGSGNGSGRSSPASASASQGGTAGYAPKRGQGATNAGAGQFGHGTRGSVSAIAAQFENGSK